MIVKEASVLLLISALSKGLLAVCEQCGNTLTTLWLTAGI